MGKENDLLEAARSGNIAIVEKLLSSKSKSKWPTSIQTLGFLKGPNVNCQDQNGETPLHFAALNNHKEIVELLLKYQASANIPDQKGCYPLHLAAWRGNFEICQILLTNGPSVAIINNQNLDGDTALHSASQYGHTDVVGVLLQKCANPLIKNNKGEKALDLAVMFGRQETVEKLLGSPDSKIYLNLTKQDKSPLHLAAKSGNVNVVRMLLSAGFNVNHQTDSGTALHEASLHGKLEVFKLLLSQGGDVMLTSSTNKTTIDLLNELSNPVSLDMKKLALDFDNEKMKTAQKNIDSAKYFSVGEDYDVIPKVAGRRQGSDSISRLSRNSVGSSTSSVFQGAGEEESIYDCPQAGARALYPLTGAAKVPLNSSSFNKIEKPNTPKKPPRKKVTNGSSKTVEKRTAVDRLPDSCRNSPSGGGPSDGTDGVTSNYGTPVGSFNSDKTSSGSASTQIPTPPSKPPPIKSLAPASTNADQSESVVTGVHGSGLSPRISSAQNRASLASASPTVSVLVGSTRSSHERDLGTRPDNLSMIVKGADAPCEPPTPDHPPPSPETALLDIQQLINSERRKSRDMHTSTEFDEPNVSAEPLRTSASRRETFHNICRNSPSKEPNNNNSIFHGLTLGSSPLSTISPTRKSSRMLRFNHLMNSRTLPSFLPSIASRNVGEDGGMPCDLSCQRLNRTSKDPGSSLHFNSSQTQRVCPQVVTEVDGMTEANKEDWTQLEHLFKTSLTGGLETLMSEFDKRMTTILSGKSSNSILSITDWLESINMLHVENILIVNGFDDMQFMSLLELADMEEIGIKNEEQRSVLSKHCKLLPPPPEPCFDSIREWLESLRLSEYYDMLTSQGCSEISQIFDFADSPLQNTFKYMLPGHRKRVKNSARWYCSKFSNFKKIESKAGVVDNRTSDAHRRPESLITGCCNYTVRYLGSKEVSVADGSDPPKLAITKIKDSLTCIDEMPTVTLSISYLGVRFIDLTNKMVICSHDISNIFSASQGEDCLKYFAYITQSADDGPFLCHVFHARSEELAREIMMTLGEAFYVAYQMAIREQNPVVSENLKKAKMSKEDSAALTSLGTPVSMTTEIKQKHHSFQSRSTEI